MKVSWDEDEVEGGNEGKTTDRRLFDAALRLFARKGFEGTGIREIASQAGVTTATLYHYTAAKEDLLLKIMERGIGSLRHSAGGIVSKPWTPEAKLVSLVKMHVVAHGTWRLTMTVGDTELRALTEEHRGQLVAKRDEYERYWRQVLEEGISTKVFRINDPNLTGFALLEMCTGVAHWYSPEGQRSIEDIADSFADMALALVEASRQGERISVVDLELTNIVHFLPVVEEGRRDLL